MKVVILAGGYGTRLAELTSAIPKPMVPIGEKPIIRHLMEWYGSFGHKEFLLALGYKGEIIKSYFRDIYDLSSDLFIDFERVEKTTYEPQKIDWHVSLCDTGVDTMTGGRLLRLQKYINNDTFLLTYGDGLSNVNVGKLIEFHHSHGKIATVTAVRPPARFGEIEIVDNEVIDFKEKPQTNHGWINGGFFVFKPQIFDYLQDDQTVLEASPLENLALDRQLMAYKHDGFWQCMDTLRDKNYLETLLKEQTAPWVVGQSL